jgi:hypothetical protein
VGLITQIKSSDSEGCSLFGISPRLLEGDPFHNHLAPLDLGKLHPVFDLQALALVLELELLQLGEDLVPVVG